MTLRDILKGRGMDKLRDSLEGIPEDQIEAVFDYVVGAFLELAPPEHIDPHDPILQAGRLSVAFDEALPSLILPTVLFLTSIRDSIGEFWVSGGNHGSGVQ